MEKTAMACPFSKRTCTECAVYRGRHRYLGLSKEHGRRTKGHRESSPSESPSLSGEFQALQKAAEPRTGKRGQRKDELRIRLRVIDVERNETRICPLHELERWDWSNPRIWRLIDGRQITDFDHLLEILRYKAETGHEEVALYEASRFMMLAGG
jgi:hypothetical protein